MLLCLKFTCLARERWDVSLDIKVMEIFELLLIGIKKRMIIGCEERNHEKKLCNCGI
jgi:hypothetical protein